MSVKMGRKAKILFAHSLKSLGSAQSLMVKIVCGFEYEYRFGRLKSSAHLSEMAC